jgi:gamma-glutamylcyclotransferase (GGCT)/AIG2-like uncharacterized protein YtfP
MSQHRLVLPPTGDPMTNTSPDNIEFAKWLQSTLDDNYYTLDGPELYKKKFHYVFTYGTLKQGFTRSASMTGQGGKLVGPAYTVSDNYIMERTNAKYSYPYILSSTDKDKKAHISGEVWKIPTKVLFELDFIESNGEMYDRTLIPVEVMLGPQRKPVKMMAWAYIGRNDYWKDTSDPKSRPKVMDCEFFKRNSDPNYKYYHFMKKYTFQQAS